MTLGRTGRRAPERSSVGGGRSSFTAFLEGEDMTLEAAHKLIDDDKTGKVLKIMLDKYAYSLARSSDKVRSTNTCLAYFGNAKNWLLDKYPVQGAIVKPQLQKVLSGLGKFCTKREDGGYEKKAPPCSKQDLESIVMLLYTSASADSVYLDASLVVMLWYLYGRSSDAEQLEKQQLSVLPGGVLFLRFKRVKTALLQGISLFKDPTSFLTCPLFTLAAALTMQTAPSKRFFPQFQTKKRSADVASDVEELSLVELLEVEDDPAPLQAQTASGKRSVPGAQAYVNRLLVRVRQVAQEKQTRLTSGLTSHSFRRGAAMHDNDGSVAENWIIERGGWQLDRVNKAFGYMLGSTQADRNVSRVLSGWSPKKGARLPSLHALEQPIRDRATKFQALIFTNSMAFADTTLNLDEDVAECLVATLLMHYPDLLLLAETSALVTRMRETMAARAIGEAEVLAWSAAIRIAFDPPEKTPPPEETSEIAAVLDVVKRQSKQIEVQILQNKRLEERLLAIETHLRMKMVDQAPITRPDADQQAAAPTPQQDSRAIRPKKKGSQSLSSVWFEWFTSEPRVYASRSVKNSTLHEFRHAVGYMLLFLPIGFALDGASDAFKSEVLSAGVKAQDNTLAFLKANGSSALAVGTVIKALRKLHKEGKLDEHIAQFHERSNAGSIVDPTPASALPAFIRLQPKQ